MTQHISLSALEYAKRLSFKGERLWNSASMRFLHSVIRLTIGHCH